MLNLDFASLKCNNLQSASLLHYKDFIISPVAIYIYNTLIKNTY